MSHTGGMYTFGGAEQEAGTQNLNNLGLVPAYNSASDKFDVDQLMNGDTYEGDDPFDFRGPIPDFLTPLDDDQFQALLDGTIDGLGPEDNLINLNNGRLTESSALNAGTLPVSAPTFTGSQAHPIPAGYGDSSIPANSPLKHGSSGHASPRSSDNAGPPNFFEAHMSPQPLGERNQDEPSTLALNLTSTQDFSNNAQDNQSEYAEDDEPAFLGAEGAAEPKALTSSINIPKENRALLMQLHEERLTESLAVGDALPATATSGPTLVGGLTDKVHDFSHLAGGARESFYTPRRRVAPKGARELHAIQAFVLDKANLVRKIKNAIVYIQPLPTVAERGFEDNVKSDMSKAFEDHVAWLLVRKSDVDKTISEVSEMIFDSMVRLHEHGDHFYGDAMPCHSTFKKTIDNNHSLQERFDCVIKACEECKRVCINVFEGHDYIAKFVAEPYSVHKALFAAAKSNLERKTRAVRNATSRTQKLAPAQTAADDGDNDDDQEQDADAAAVTPSGAVGGCAQKIVVSATPEPANKSKVDEPQSEIESTTSMSKANGKSKGMTGAQTDVSKPKPAARKRHYNTKRGAAETRAVKNSPALGAVVNTRVPASVQTQLEEVPPTNLTTDRRTGKKRIASTQVQDEYKDENTGVPDGREPHSKRGRFGE